MIPDWWRLGETPEQIHARALWHFQEGDRLMALLPTDHFDHSTDYRHGSLPRGEALEASEISGVTA